MSDLTQCPVCGAKIDEKSTIGLYGRHKTYKEIAFKCGARYDLRYGRLNVNSGWDGTMYYCPKILDTVIEQRARIAELESQLRKALETINNAEGRG